MRSAIPKKSSPPTPTKEKLTKSFRQ
jgi:hypothetical protein